MLFEGSILNGIYFLSFLKKMPHINKKLSNCKLCILKKGDERKKCDGIRVHLFNFFFLEMPHYRKFCLDPVINSFVVTFPQAENSVKKILVCVIF